MLWVGIHSISLDTDAYDPTYFVQPLIKYCQRDDPQVREWSAELEERWGMKIKDYVSLERRQPPPVLSLQQIELESQPSADQQEDTVRPLHEQRAGNRAQQLDPRGSTSMRSVGDTDINPALQGGLGPRTHVPGDGPPSLPSLKSSGLLDSWSALSDSAPAPGQSLWNSTPHARLEAPLPLPTNTQNQSESESSRPVSTGMPVGMAWLANEPTTAR
jgi:hypothetical protein